MSTSEISSTLRSPLLHMDGVQITYSGEIRAVIFPPFPSTYCRSHSFFPARTISCFNSTTPGDPNKSSGLMHEYSGTRETVKQSRTARRRIGAILFVLKCFINLQIKTDPVNGRIDSFLSIDRC